MVRETLGTSVLSIGLLGNFGRMHGLLSSEICFYRVLPHKAVS